MGKLAWVAAAFWLGLAAALAAQETGAVAAPASREQLENSKLALETEKLGLEIDKLRREGIPWGILTPWIGLASAVLGGVVALRVGSARA